ncbi:hypothetical protein PWT90_04148 [Aphanocladium album]|nr:hypothetical protein PWT90_04148 [Aphanocladium album]
MNLSSYVSALLSWAVLVNVSFTEAAAANITAAFDIKFGSDLAGGCKYVGETSMNTLFKDSLVLADAGIKATQTYGTDPRATRLLNAFFGAGYDLTSDMLTEITNHYVTIKKWIESPTPTKDGKKPMLFCDHTWLQRQDMQSQARDKDGNLMEDDEGNALKIKDVEDYRNTQKEEQALLGGKKAFPYYSSVHKGYLYDMTHGGPTKGYCDETTEQAGTSHRLSTTTLTLCPRAFGASQNIKGRKVTYRGLHSAEISPWKRKDIVKGNIPSTAPALSNEIVPTAATLFHELFHVVLGNEITFPSQGECYGLDAMLALGFDEAKLNPETFALVAVAYDYTENTQDGIEFYPGWAVVD